MYGRFLNVYLNPYLRRKVDAIYIYNNHIFQNIIIFGLQAKDVPRRYGFSIATLVLVNNYVAMLKVK